MEKYLPENFARWDLRKLQRKKQKERENKQTKELERYSGAVCSFPAASLACKMRVGMTIASWNRGEWSKW